MTGIPIHHSVLQLRSQQLRAYVYHYLDIEPIMDEFISRLSYRTGGFCVDCPLIHNDYDVGAFDCPTGFDYMDYNCNRWYIIDHYLPYLITLDLMMREEFGDSPNVPEEYNTLHVDR